MYTQALTIVSLGLLVNPSLVAGLPVAEPKSDHDSKGNANVKGNGNANANLNLNLNSLLSGNKEKDGMSNIAENVKNLLYNNKAAMDPYSLVAIQGSDKSTVSAGIGDLANLYATFVSGANGQAKKGYTVALPSVGDHKSYKPSVSTFTPNPNSIFSSLKPLFEGRVQVNLARARQLAHDAIRKNYAATSTPSSSTSPSYTQPTSYPTSGFNVGISPSASSQATPTTSTGFNVGVGPASSQTASASASDGFNVGISASASASASPMTTSAFNVAVSPTSASPMSTATPAAASVSASDGFNVGVGSTTSTAAAADATVTASANGRVGRRSSSSSSSGEKLSSAFSIVSSSKGPFASFGANSAFYIFSTYTGANEATGTKVADIVVGSNSGVHRVDGGLNISYNF